MEALLYQFDFPLRAHGNAGRIAVLLHSLAGGGAQRRVATLANGFAASGRAVDVLTPDLRGAAHDALAPGVGVMALDPRHPAAALQAYLDRVRPDILMSGVTNTHALAVRARRAAGAPVALVLRASRHPIRPIPWAMPVSRLLERGRRLREAALYRAADATVAVSPDVARGLAQVLGAAARIETVLNPVVTPELLRQAECEPDHPWADAAVPIVLGIGRLRPQKDFATLVRAFARVRADRPARLVILGSGEEHGRLATLARRLGVADDVLLAGESDRVGGWLRRARVLVSTSLWEGSSAVPVEAMALGCPVVAADCPGDSRDCLGDGRYGRLVPMRDPVAVADAIMATLAAPTLPALLREGAARYDAAGKADRYLALFDSLTAAVAISRSGR